MAIMDVLPYPNPFLRRRADPVSAFDQALKDVVSDMEETMADRDGIGLAATQVGLNLRLLLLSPYAFEGESGLGKPNVVIINPEIVEQSSETEIAEEGCLSFPHIFIPVERPSGFAFALMPTEKFLKSPVKAWAHDNFARDRPSEWGGHGRPCFASSAPSCA